MYLLFLIYGNLSHSITDIRCAYLVSLCSPHTEYGGNLELIHPITNALPNYLSSPPSHAEWRCNIISSHIWWMDYVSSSMVVVMVVCSSIHGYTVSTTQWSCPQKQIGTKDGVMKNHCDVLVVCAHEPAVERLAELVIGPYLPPSSLINFPCCWFRSESLSL